MNVEFSKKKIEDLMEELKDSRPVFNSEDDFKFSLAWLIKENYENNVDIRLEKKMNNNKDASSSEECDQNNKNQRIDIFIIVKNDKEKIGIELKYFTAEIEWRDKKNDETFKLANQAAYNIKCYDAWKDVERLENFIRCGNINKGNKGFAIWLTNIKSLTDDWDKIEKKSKKEPNYYNFRICDERPVGPNEILDWKEDTSDGMKKGREDSINISGYYKVHWEEYKDLNNEQENINEKSSNKKNSNKVFKYAILEVQ